MIKLNNMINQAIRFGISVYIIDYCYVAADLWCCRCSLTNEGNSYTLFMTSKNKQWIEGKHNQQQQQQQQTTSELQAVVIPSIDTFMKRLQQGGLL